LFQRFFRRSMQPEFQRLETILRQNEIRLKQETTERFRRIYQDQELISREAENASGYMHDLALVAVALFPSEVSLESAYKWATQPQGLLKRYNINLEHQKA